MTQHSGNRSETTKYTGYWNLCQYRQLPYYIGLYRYLIKSHMKQPLNCKQLFIHGFYSIISDLYVNYNIYLTIYGIRPRAFAFLCENKYEQSNFFKYRIRNALSSRSRCIYILHLFRCVININTENCQKQLVMVTLYNLQIWD